LQEIQHTSIPAAALKRPRSSGIPRRGWLALGAVLAILFSAAGGFIAYANTLPTVATLNVKDGATNVPTDTQLVLRFTRPVALTTVQSALSVAPSTASTLTAVLGQTEFQWAPAKPLTELTPYTVTLKALTDLGHHSVKAAQWTFTTIIVPHVLSISSPGGVALTNGGEIDPGMPLQINFNDAMNQATVSVTIGTKVASLKWASDGRSAVMSTVGVPSGPIAIQLALGAVDETGHPVSTPFSLKTGIYYHDPEATTALKYPALIQIPNDEFAWDQNGLQAAGIVFEYVAEGGITRLTAIYQNAPSLIGPMRSSRFISLRLARHYKGLLFQSGESQATRNEAAGVPQFFDTFGYTYRTAARVAPDNLMISGAAVKRAESLYGIAAFVVPKTRPDLGGGTAVGKVGVAEHYSTYAYDPAFGTYQKTEEGHLYRNPATHQPLRIEMLITLHTQVELLNVGDGHGSYIHDYNLDTSGRIDIFYKGHKYAGTWSSTGAHNPLSFKLSNGQPLSLPPGLVWIDVTS
jgi:Protein of unknown function (DUF3048) N-terminal domain/Protein of unknown function (DUF3048) C-terminal domain/Bacterial Ig-like domain